MSNLNMYCLSINEQIKEKIKELNYIPVGLGIKNYPEGWLRDNTGQNISVKNKYYGEYSFHYWFWKNALKNYNEKYWIGFCAYRRFWGRDIKINKNIVNLKDNVLQEIPKSWDIYDAIIGDEVNISKIKWIKILKYGKRALLSNPKALIEKNRNIKFQFDMMHGSGILDKAINLLSSDDKDDFYKFIISKNSYNQGNMFISKSKKLMNDYYTSVFNWLEKCEKIFGFNLEGYGKQRLYAFLAERYLPFWFNKYSKCMTWPIFFYELN